ncbi:hypothetical protein EMIT0158MI4_60278 [Burkholderia ambifaria]
MTSFSTVRFRKAFVRPLTMIGKPLMLGPTWESRAAAWASGSSKNGLPDSGLGGQLRYRRSKAFPGEFSCNVTFSNSLPVTGLMVFHIDGFSLNANRPLLSTDK